MRRGLAAGIALLALGACRGQTAAPVAARAEGRFGTVQLYAPLGGRRGCVFLFSDAAGWNDGLSRDARALAAAGAAVVGVDLPQYLAGLAASDDGCHYLISEVEQLSKQLQIEYGFDGYRSPILAGIGAGATLAYAALAQTPAATVAGAISIDPAPALATRVALCPGAPSQAAAGGGFSYGAVPRLPGWWEVSPPDAVAPALRGLATPVPGGGDADTRLLAAARAALASASATTGSPLAQLPLIELPAAAAGQTMAVVYSGDGGWRDIDKQIGEVLAARGVPVVGVDSLRYFWRPKTPDDIARDLAAVIAHYSPLWHTPRVALVGYSFGAGILPFAYNRLPAADRDRVVQMTLLGVEHRALFEFKLSEWLGVGPDADAPPVMPEIARFPAALRLQCVYGEDEQDTVCREPALAAAEIIHTTGGHHFDGDYKALADRILTGLAG